MIECPGCLLWDNKYNAIPVFQVFAVWDDLNQPTSFPGGVDIIDALEQTGCQGR